MWQPVLKLTSAALQTAPSVLHSAVTFPVAFSNCNRERRLLCLPLFLHLMCVFLVLSPYLLYCCGNNDLCSHRNTHIHTLGVWHLLFKLVSPSSKLVHEWVAAYFQFYEDNFPDTQIFYTLRTGLITDSWLTLLSEACYGASVVARQFPC